MDPDYQTCVILVFVLHTWGGGHGGSELVLLNNKTFKKRKPLMYFQFAHRVSICSKLLT